MNSQFLLMLWLAWTAVCLVALVFIMARPAAWAALVEKENNYWVRRGWFSTRFAEKARRLETGATMKLLLGANVILGVVIIALVLRAGRDPHFKAMLPPKPKPALQSRPVN